jgi:hypothetical protein
VKFEEEAAARARKEITDTMIRAITETWKGLDRAGAIFNEAHNLSTIQGGCRAMLTGDFQLPYDAVSLGLSLLTLAREHMIATGGTLPGVALTEEEPS